MLCTRIIESMVLKLFGYFTVSFHFIVILLDHQRIQQYHQNEHYALWEVIVFGDSYKAPPKETCKGPVSESSKKKKGRTVVITKEDMQKRRNDVKAITTLLLALPDEHQLRFSKYETAQELWEAILKTFGENEATKKRKKNQLKQQYGNFKAEGSETLKQTFNRLQAIVSHLEFMDVEIKQDDLNQKFLTSLAPEWLMYTIVWRNRDDLDTMSLDDVYNHLKAYDPEVQKKSESNSQNMAFISSNTNSGKGKVHTASVPTASTQVSTASTDVADASLSHDTVCAYIASQSNGSRIKYKDITQIDKDDIKEMDIKWNVALLSMRADRAPRSQDRGKEKATNKSYMANEEENHSLVADDEVLTEFALMAKSSSSSKNEVEARLVEFKKQEIKFCEKIRGLERDVEGNIDDKGYWDSGCSRNMTGNISYLSEYEPHDGGYVLFGQRGEKISGKGIIKTDFKLKDDTNVFLRTPRQHNMYSIDLNNIVPYKNLTCLVAKASIDEIMLWHRRLGHLNFKTMNKLVRNNLVRGLPSKCFENDHTCVACLKRKHHKPSYKTKLLNSFYKPLYTLHIDLFGPTSVSSLNHKWYCLVVMDDFSRCDNGGEFKNKEMNEFCTKKEIRREFSNARTPQQNRVAERRNRTLIKAARTMLADAKLPVTFWAEAVNTACCVQNRVLVDKGKNCPKNNFAHKSMSPRAVLLKPGTSPIAETKEKLLRPQLVGFGDLNKTLLRKEEPKKIFDALNDPSWVEAIQEELLQFKIQNVWISVDFPKGVRPIGTKWVLKNKKDERIEAIRLSLAYASFIGFIVYQMDVKSAFLYGTIDEEVYMMQPPGFQDLEFPDRVYKVEKAVYGLHQAPRAWYGTLSKYLLDNGFQRGIIDQTLFIRKHKGEFLLVQVYVDDIIFGSSNPQLCREFETLMHEKFQMSAIGELTFFLGLQVLQKKDGIFLSQDKYVGDILKKFGYSDVRSANTPMDKENPWGKDGPGKDVELHLYRSMIGSLMYLTASRPDLMFAICACARHQVTPKECHLHAVKRIFRYLKGHPKLGTIVATSTTEAEYVAAASGCGQVLWIQNQMLDYGNFIMAKLAFCDYHNMIAVLEKTEHNIEFHQIVDFLEDFHIKYALTISPTVYVSHIRQFWSTVRIETTNLETKILATVDGSVTPTEPHHTPSPQEQHSPHHDPSSPSHPTKTTKPIPQTPTETPTETPTLRRYTRRAIRIAQSKALSPAVDEKNINKTSALPHESSPRVTSLDADEGSMQQRLQELMDLCTSLQRQQTQMAAKIKDQDLEISGLKARVKFLEDNDRGSAESTQEDASIKRGIMETGEEVGAKKSIELGSNDTGEMVNVLSSMEATNILTSGVVAASVSPAAGVSTASVPTVSGSFPTVSAIFTTASVVTPYTRRPREITIGGAQQMRSPIIRAKDKGKQKMVESEVPKKRKIQEQIDAQVAREMEEEFEKENKRLSEQLARDSEIARLHAEEELKMMIKGLDRSNEVIAKHLQEYEQAKADLTVREKIELINELEQREFYMSVLRSHAGWKTKHFRRMTLEEIKEKFIPVWKQLEDFVPMSSKEEGERVKRKGLKLDQGSTKRMKTSEDVSEDDLKGMMQLVPLEEVYIEALQVKHPIIDWEIHSDEKREYWKIIILGGHTEVYQFFVDMLKQFDREDLHQLWTLVKENLSIRPTTKDKEKELWVELKRLFEPDFEDQLWTHNQALMHDPLE
nr:hypothetical protein [Tanacetum cinerariifolium]